MRPCAVEPIEIPTGDGFAVRGDLYTSSRQTRSGIIVLCHGFKGYRTWGFFPYVAGRFVEAGFAALAIDFSFNGTYSAEWPHTAPPPAGDRFIPFGPTTPPPHIRPDLFRRNTIQREIADLIVILRAIARDGIEGRIQRGAPVGLFGYSRGAVVATLVARENDAVGALCTWSCPVHPDHFTAAQKARWRKNGEYAFTDARDGTRLALSTGYLDDLEANRDAYDLLHRVAGLRVPHLIVHGEADLAVRVADARALHEAEKELHDKRLLVIRTGHTFRVTDDMEIFPKRTPRALVEASDTTTEWFTHYLEKGN